MPDNLRYIHGVWLVVRPTIYFTNTEARAEATVSWTRSRVDGQQRRQTKEERKGQIKKTNVNCERKRSKVGNFGIYIQCVPMDLHSLKLK